MTALVQVEDLVKNYARHSTLIGKTQYFNAVDGVSLSIQKGETVGLLGESGCGKSTLGRMMVGLEEPTAGSVLFSGKNIYTLRFEQLRLLHKDMQMIFQNNTTIFNPYFTIGSSIMEVLFNFAAPSSKEALKLVMEMLEKVGLDEECFYRYPDELSGGQRQRANIARAMVLHPAFVVCDEPVSSLDFSIRKQILNLFKELQRSFDVTMLFITHDITTVKYVCDRLIIMYLGKVVESLDSIEDLDEQISHPYTRMLFKSVPAADPEKRRDPQKRLTEHRKGGDLSQTMMNGDGCRFYERCRLRMPQCERETPGLRRFAPGHFIACHCIR